MIREKYINILEDVYNNEFTISNFISMQEKATFNHSKCNDSFEMRPDSFFKKGKITKCPNCDLNEKHNDFVKSVKELTGNEYEVIGKYKSMKSKLDMKHSNCGTIYPVSPYQFKDRGDRCPECRINKKSNTNEFKEYVFNRYGNEYEVMSEYINNSTHIQMKHNCGYEYPITPSNFKAGYKCPECSHNRKKDDEIFKNEILEIVGSEYTLESSYINTHEHVTLRHSKCNKTFPTRPNNFLQGYRCPHCSDSKNSKGVVAIKEYLESNNFYYETEKTFDDLINPETGRNLYFDFYLECENGDKIFIEYDGEHHFIEKKHFGGKKKLLEYQKRDKLKDTYCEVNNYMLIRINYKSLNDINKILEEIFE